MIYCHIPVQRQIEPSCFKSTIVSQCHLNTRNKESLIHYARPTMREVIVAYSQTQRALIS